MATQVKQELFGSCTNIGECEAVCPKDIKLEVIARMNRDYLRASWTQRGDALRTIRLGKRTERRVPKIHDFVPLASLDDLVFGGWDIYEDNCYESAVKAGVLDRNLLEAVRPKIEKIKPWRAVFSQEYVKRLQGPNVKSGKNKMELAEQVMDDIEQFRKQHNVAQLVMVWCGSTEAYLQPGAAHASLAAFEKALQANDPSVAPSMVYAYAALSKI